MLTVFEFDCLIYADQDMKLTTNIDESSAESARKSAANVISQSQPAYPALFVCDHASNEIPDEMNGLGLSDELLATHIAWDIGAARVLRCLVELLTVPAVLGTCSRLVVDCNRRLDDVTAFPEFSDGIAVPGNANLTAAEREARAEQVYWPYHHEVRDQLRALEQYVAAPALIAIHSFTPAMNGSMRPWQIGALWDKDDRIARPFMEKLRVDHDAIVGDNEPYSGKHPADFTIDHHAEAEGLPHLAIEVRQDLVETDESAMHWSRMLADVLAQILEDRNLYTHRAGAL